MTNRIILAFISLLLASCASLPSGGSNDPRTIVIRNRSGADIASVTLREPSRGGREARFGTIAPVPQGVSQQIGRPSDPPAFPRTLVVEWVDQAGRTVVREVSVSKALQGATGVKGEALVFEIGQFEDVLVMIENGPK